MPLHSPEACVIGEPTGSSGVAISYRGRILFDIKGEDDGAHRSGSPGPITDSVMAASSIIDITRNMGKGYSVAIMEMEGHEAGKRSASITMDLRTPLGAGQEELELMIRETAAAFGVRSEIIEYVPPYGVHKSDPVIRAFRNAIRDCGETPRVLAKQGTCDFTVLSLPGAVTWALTDPATPYTTTVPMNSPPVSEYLKGIEVLKLALPRIMASI